MKKAAFLLISIIIFSGCAKKQSGLVLPSLIGDNMVLQQKTDIQIWGWANQGKEIKVIAEWGAEGTSVAGDDKTWSVKMPSPEAGGPYSITISASDTTITVTNILIGEVWICSGQSNMEMPLAGWPPNDTIMHSAKSISEATVPGIRLFVVQRKASAGPLDDCTGKWVICDPSTVPQFSATAYFFGKRIHDELNIPVGLIESAWGGTPAEAWISSEALEGSGEFVSEIKEIKESLPLVAEYETWLNSHKQLSLGDPGSEQWKNLDFSDEIVAATEYNDSEWLAMNLPGQFESVTGEFDGVIWFRKNIDLPESMAGKQLTLSLGPIDDMDRTYFNGKLIGSNELEGFWQAERNYSVPGELVRSGPNTISVRVLDNQGGGGIWGKPGSMKLISGGSSVAEVSLEGSWKYQPAAELIGNRFYVFDPSKKDFYAVARPKAIGPSTPSSLFNGMIKPLVSYPVRGAIWYQGEGNVGRADQYSKIFPLLISNWRDVWNNEDMAFYFVQIAPYIYSGVDSTESAYLRESQEKALKLPNTGMVVTLDLATVMNIHPPFKKEVGERLASLALAKNYGKDVKWQGPVFRSATIDGRSIRVQFDHTGDGLLSKGKRISGFDLAGKDGIYYKADARIVGGEVLVTSPKVPEPVFVRYCWRNGSEATVFSSDGLPALQFRTM